MVTWTQITQLIQTYFNHACCIYLDKPITLLVTPAMPHAKWQSYNPRPGHCSSLIAHCHALQWPHNDHFGIWNHLHSIVCSTICLRLHQEKYQSLCYWPFVRGIHWWLVDSPHIWSVTWKMFPLHDVIMGRATQTNPTHLLPVSAMCNNVFYINIIIYTANVYYAQPFEVIKD